MNDNYGWQLSRRAVAFVGVFLLAVFSFFSAPDSAKAGERYLLEGNTAVPISVGNSDSVSATPAIPATIAVTSPNGGESWLEWSWHDITWTTTGTIANIMIEYSTNSGSSYITVIASTANTGHYGWTIPTTLSANCLVKISDAANSSVYDASDAVFSINVCGFISGAVTNISGTPLKDVEVDAYTQSNVWAASVTTDAAGLYTIGSLGSGGYKVLFFPPQSVNYQWQWYNDKNHFNPADTVNVVVGNTTGNINAHLSAGGIISGRVTDEGGAGLNGVSIYAFAENSFLAYWVATSDTNGNYQINGLPTGNYGVWYDLTADGYARKSYNNTYLWDATTPVSVSVGAQTTGIDMVLEKGGYISGKVTDGASNPISGIRVMAYDASSKRYMGTSAVSAADGTYSILARPGQTKVYFDASSKPASGLHSQFYSLQNSLDNAGIVTVQKEQTTVNIDAVLATGGGKITIQVKNSQGLGFPAAIYLFDTQYYTRIMNCTATDDNGFLEIKGLYAGNYKLHCFDTLGELGRYSGQWYNAAKSYAGATAVSVTEGGNTSIVITLTEAFRKDDLLGTWTGQGVYYRNSDTGAWVQVATSATKITAGDLDGDGIADLIGIWPSQGGVWVKYSKSGTWALLSSTADWIAAADMNGDGRAELLGSWTGQGVFWRDNTTGAWTQLATPATKVTAGDLDGDGIADLIGIWPSQGGVWVKYSQSGSWAFLSSTADWIAAGDMNGDGRADLLGAWTGQGVYYRDSMTGQWVLMATPATMITAGDLDADGKDDLIGIWSSQGGVWVKYSQSGTWAYLSSTADWIATGKMRAASGQGLGNGKELALPMGGLDFGPQRITGYADLSANSPGREGFRPIIGKNLRPEETKTTMSFTLRIPGPGESGFKYVQQKNLFPVAELPGDKSRKTSGPASH